MTAPKENQQPMTTREEFEQAWRERPWRHKNESAKDIAFSWWEASRLASRQEVSVEELGLALRLVAPDELLPAFFKRGSDVRKSIARDMARSLLANYSITKRTTEG